MVHAGKEVQIMASRSDIWLKKARAGKKSKRMPLREVHNTGQYAVASDGERLHIVLGSEYGEHVESFPDVGFILDEIKKGEKVTVSRDHLMRAIKAAKAWRNPHEGCRLSFNGSLIVEGKGEDGRGECRIQDGESWPGVGQAVYRYQGEDVERVFNARFLIDALQGMSGDTVLLLVSKDVMGVVAGDRIAAIMPIDYGAW